MYSKNDVWILIDKNNHIVVIENKLFSTNYQDLLGQKEVQVGWCQILFYKLVRHLQLIQER